MMPVADSSVKLKITVQKEALKIKTFSFSACCCFKYKYCLCFSNGKEARQDKEEINSRSAVKERGADNMASSCDTFEVRCC